MSKKLINLVILLFVSAPALARTIQTNPDSIPFAHAVNYVAGNGPVSVFCADLDGDSDLDLAVANEYIDTVSGNYFVSTFENNGNGTFRSKVDYAVGNTPASVFCADLDGDSDLDLAVANAFSDSVSILKNNGYGAFQLDGNYPAGWGSGFVFCADLDGDSDLDLAVANWYSGDVSILKNNGNGSFQSKVDYAVGNTPYSVFCADLDGDSDLDLAVANCFSDNVSLLKNNGNGSFESKVDYAVGIYPTTVFCADLDGDSYLDLAVANCFSDNVSVLLNQTAVDVEDREDVNKLPERYSLFQNTPNPFNQTTKIKFTLGKSGFVTLNIYDILGRKVKTLVSEHLSSGYKSVLWDGMNDAGKGLASGIYFYQLRVGDFSETKKLVLLK